MPSSAGAPAGGAAAGGAPAGGATGSAGSTGTGNCAAPAWASGKTYKVGDVLTGICQIVGGGATVCMQGKKYAWTCFGSTCSVYAPGADGWWGNWTLGSVCN